MAKSSVYPAFKRGEVVQYYNSLPVSEKKIINSFIDYVSIESSSKARLDNNRRTITQLRYITDKNFKDIDLEDLRHYLALLKKSDKTTSTQTDYKASIKRFLRWHFPNWSERFDNLRDIKLKFGYNEEKINASTILKKEDIEKLVKAENSLFWKTFFICLYETGLRPYELRKLTWDKVELGNKNNISKIYVFATKTSKARTTFIKEGTYYLSELKRRYEIQGNISRLVFPSPRNINKPMDKGRVSEWLKKLTTKVLGRAVTPYMLRHTRATELYINPQIPDKIAQKVLGHGKNMGDIYTHLSDNDVEDVLGSTIYNFEDISPEEKHQLKEDVEQHKMEIRQLKEKIEIMGKYDAIANNIFEDKRLQKALLKSMIENGYGKQLLELSGN